MFGRGGDYPHHACFVLATACAAVIHVVFDVQLVASNIGYLPHLLLCRCPYVEIEKGDALIIAGQNLDVGSTSLRIIRVVGAVIYGVRVFIVLGGIP